MAFAEKELKISVINLNPEECPAKVLNDLNQKNPNRRYVGIVLTLLSSLTFAIGTLIVKQLTNSGYHPFNIGVWRFQGIFVVYLPILIFCALDPKKNVFGRIFSRKSDAISPNSDGGACKIWGLIFARCLAGCSAIVLQYMSLQDLNLADSLVITFSTPVFITLVSPLVMKEKWRVVPILLAIVTLLGVGVMIRPPALTGGTDFDSSTLTGYAFALAAMIATGASFILTQSLRQIHFSVMMTAFGGWGTIECIILSFAYLSKVNYPVGAYDWGLAIILAAMSVISQTSLTLGLKFEKAGPVSLIRSCDVIFGLALQFFILEVQLDWISLSGQFIVICGVLITIAREWIRKLDACHPVRLKCSWLLR